MCGLRVEYGDKNVNDSSMREKGTNKNKKTILNTPSFLLRLVLVSPVFLLFFYSVLF
jgi:hypothetical protein